MKIKVLILSAIPWNTNTNFGNSYSGIFEGMDNLDFINIYLSEGTVNEGIVSRSFEISEKRLYKNLINSSIKPGMERAIEPEKKEAYLTSSILRSFGKQHKIMLLYLVRDLLWRIGKWDTKDLDYFIRSSNPDIIFLPINGSAYPNRIALKLAERYNLPILGYISDDNYTFEVFSISPLFWLRRFVIRHYVGKAIRASKVLYVISEKQKLKYDQIFNINSKILTKGIEDSFNRPPFEKRRKNYFSFIYTGGLGIGRWKSLALLANEIDLQNSEKMVFELIIYSTTALNKRIQKAFDKRGVRFCGPIPSAQVPVVQANEDIMVHVESMDFSKKKDALYGFSTKIVDYMSMRKPILAIGDREQASIAYMQENSLGMIATNQKEIHAIIESIKEDAGVLNKYADRAYKWGHEHHSKQSFQQMIMEDINDVISEL